MSESVASAMAAHCVCSLILFYVLYLQQPATQALASPLSIRNFNFTKAIDTVKNISGKFINGTKSFLGWSPEPVTTKSPLLVVLLPKRFSTGKRNVSEDETTKYSTVRISANSSQPARKKSWWSKAKSFVGWTEASTTQSPRYVWLIPVDYDKLTATGTPCQRGQIQSGYQGCLSSQEAGVSWWTLSFALAGALLMCAVTWLAITRGRALARRGARDSVEVRPRKLPSPLTCYASGPDLVLSATALPPAKKSPGPPPTWPVPPVPVANRANSLYQTEQGMAAHVYATPSPCPRQNTGRVSHVNDHVHIYEIPPCFPGYDFGDQEIDSTALKKTAFRHEEAKC